MLLVYVVQEHFVLLHKNKSLTEPFTCLSTQEDRSCSQPEYATKYSFQLLNPCVGPYLKVHSLYIKMILTFANPNFCKKKKSIYLQLDTQIMKDCISS